MTRSEAIDTIRAVMARHGLQCRDLADDMAGCAARAPQAGMAMVPLEPLMSMSEAGSDAVGDEVSGPGCHRIYVAMVKHWLSLAAAPNAQEE